MGQFFIVVDKPADFPLAYIILVETSEIEQVERLLYSIYTPDNFYCLHVDKTSRLEIIDIFQRLASCFLNVFLARLDCEGFFFSFMVHSHQNSICNRLASD